MHVSGSDPSDSVAVAAKKYELYIESCYPGISATDWKGIFEEQLVVNSYVLTL